MERLFTSLIDGEAVPRAANFGAINPATGQLFAQSQRADADLLDQAVAAVRSTFSPGSAL